ncbi:hypothetical protein GQ457_13G018050 [Hibiscus cannabinus]
MDVNRNNSQPPADGQELPARADGAIVPPAQQMNQQLPARTVRDYLAEDLEGLNPAVTMPDFEAEHSELKPHALSPLPCVLQPQKPNPVDHVSFLFPVLHEIPCETSTGNPQLCLGCFVDQSKFVHGAFSIFEFIASRRAYQSLAPFKGRRLKLRWSWRRTHEFSVLRRVWHPSLTRANPRGPRLELDPEIEKTQKQLKRRIRDLMNVNRNNGQQPADGQELPARADGAIAPPAPQMNQQLPARTVRDYLAEDLEGQNPAVMMPYFEAEHFELKPMIKDKFEKHMDNMLDVRCLVLATLTLELQKLHEYVVSYEMIQNLKEIFEGKARQ